MATSDTSSAFGRLMARATEPLPEATWSEPGDLGRLSIEAMAAQRVDNRELASHGAVRLTGAGVIGHSAPLDSVGAVATSWQRCVTAVGAALEGVRSSFGQIPREVAQRTQLTLSAAPSPGSVVLELSAQADPLREVEPDGQKQILDRPRPLADRASDTLIGLLGQAAQIGPDADELGAEFLRLGPRVASHVRRLADVLEKAHFDLDVTWLEPERPTRRALVPSGTAGWLRDFVDGRALDGQETELVGTVRTVSDIAKWTIETDEGMRPVDARSLNPKVVGSTRVGQPIRLIVLVRVTERPDGTSTTTYDALDVLEPPHVLGEA